MPQTRSFGYGRHYYWGTDGKDGVWHIGSYSESVGSWDLESHILPADDYSFTCQARLCLIKQLRGV